VIFQDVVHSIWTGEAVCDEQSVTLEDRMDYHKNAPWTAVSRERLARMVIHDGLALKAAAFRFSVSDKTAAKWVGRYRQFGSAGLADRSSRPRSCPRRLP
jgi:transposase-like protein